MQKQIAGSVIETTEQERVALYALGWNDAQRNRAKRADKPIMYHIGYVDALRPAATKREIH